LVQLILLGHKLKDHELEFALQTLF